MVRRRKTPGRATADFARQKLYRGGQMQFSSQSSCDYFRVEGGLLPPRIEDKWLGVVKPDLPEVYILWV